MVVNIFSSYGELLDTFYSNDRDPVAVLALAKLKHPSAGNSFEFVGVPDKRAPAMQSPQAGWLREAPAVESAQSLELYGYAKSKGVKK